MGERQQFEVWKDTVLPALQSKLEEFELLGYDRVTIDQIWDCVLYKIRKRKTFMHIHEFVHIIMTLKVTEYMTWVTVANYSENWFGQTDKTLEELSKDVN